MIGKLLCAVGRHRFSDERVGPEGLYVAPRVDCGRCHVPNPAQSLCCYCPRCGNELCASDSFVEDTDLVRYRCSRCGHRTGWVFDSPAPFIVEGK